MKQKIEIYFPILADFTFENYPFEQQLKVIEDIREVLKITNFNTEEHIKSVKVSLSIIKNPKWELIQNLYDDFFS